MNKHPVISAVKSKIKIDNKVNLTQIGNLLTAANSFNEREEFYSLLVELGWIKRYVEEIYEKTKLYADKDR